MTIAYQHRPLSKILAPTAESTDDQTPTPTQPRNDKGQFEAVEQELPEKYRGKTTEQVAEMHMNSERRLGQIQNEVGQLRGLVTDLSTLQRSETPVTEVTPEPLDLTGDQIIADPIGSIRKVVQHDAAAAKPVETQAPAVDPLIQMETTALVNDFPDMETVTQTEDFQQFILRTPSRTADARLAAQGEGVHAVRAARRVLEDYQDFQSLQAPSPSAQAPTPLEQARAVSNAGAVASARTSSDDVMYEADVIKLCQDNPEKYRSPTFQKQLLASIREGRYVKQ